MIVNSPYPWQQNQWQLLRNSALAGKLAAAYLLIGPQGMGKGHFAQAFAKLMLCDASVQAAPCDSCQSCILFQNNNHPDFYQVAPEEPGKQIKIDQIRQLITVLQQTSIKDSYKVVVINPMTAINIAGANALLKTLEEPPSAKTVFLLLCDDLQILPATIRSRCQKVLFQQPTAHEIQIWLGRQLDEQQQLLLTFASGAPLLVLGDDANRISQVGINVLDDLLALVSQEINSLTVAERWQKHDLSELLSWLFLWLHACLKAQAHIPLDKIPREFHAKLQIIIDKKNPFALLAYMDYLYGMEKNLQRKLNLNTQLVLEDLFWQWQNTK